MPYYAAAYGSGDVGSIHIRVTSKSVENEQLAMEDCYGIISDRITCKPFPKRPRTLSAKARHAFDQDLRSEHLARLAEIATNTLTIESISSEFLAAIADIYTVGTAEEREKEINYVRTMGTGAIARMEKMTVDRKFSPDDPITAEIVSSFKVWVNSIVNSKIKVIEGTK